jgi:hypothetical protein
MENILPVGLLNIKKIDIYVMTQEGQCYGIELKMPKDD